MNSQGTYLEFRGLIHATSVEDDDEDREVRQKRREEEIRTAFRQVIDLGIIDGRSVRVESDFLRTGILYMRGSRDDRQRIHNLLSHCRLGEVLDMPSKQLRSVKPSPEGRARP